MCNLYLIEGDFPKSSTTASVQLLDECISEQRIAPGTNAVYTTECTSNRQGVLLIQDGGIYGKYLSPSKITYTEDDSLPEYRFKVTHFDPATVGTLPTVSFSRQRWEHYTKVLRERDHYIEQFELVAIDELGKLYLINIRAQIAFIFEDQSLQETYRFTDRPLKIHTNIGVSRPQSPLIRETPIDAPPQEEPKAIAPDPIPTDMSEVMQLLRALLAKENHWIPVQGQYVLIEGGLEPYVIADYDAVSKEFILTKADRARAVRDNQYSPTVSALDAYSSFSMGGIKIHESKVKPYKLSL